MRTVPNEQDDEADVETDEDIEHDPGVVDDDDGEERRGRGARRRATRSRWAARKPEVTLKELIKGYQRGADYTKKTMRLADERRGIERAKADLEGERTALALDRQRYAERLSGHIPGLQQQLAHFKDIDWNRLSAENPALFAQAKPLFDSLTGQLQQAEAERLQLAAAGAPAPASGRAGPPGSHRRAEAGAHREAPRIGRPGERSPGDRHPRPAIWSTPAIDSRSCRAWSITATSSWRARRCCTTA